jgi:hypothetical protein
MVDQKATTMVTAAKTERVSLAAAYSLMLRYGTARLSHYEAIQRIEM